MKSIDADQERFGDVSTSNVAWFSRIKPSPPAASFSRSACALAAREKGASKMAPNPAKINFFIVKVEQNTEDVSRNMVSIT